MAVCEIHLNAQPALLKMTSVTVILPDNMGPGPHPVLYLLHGLSDNHTAWTRRTSIERYVAGLPLIVVMPDGGRGWYSDSVTEPTGAYETFIVRDLVGFIDRTFRTRAERGGRVIGGLSMGGYGAVKLALKYPQMFCAAVSHSGALSRPDERNFEEGSELRRIFGERPSGGSEDIYTLAEKAAGSSAPALRIDCGVNDFLLGYNRNFHRHLESLGWSHEYAEHPGGHDWEYWDKHVRESLKFFAGALDLVGR